MDDLIKEWNQTKYYSLHHPPYIPRTRTAKNGEKERIPPSWLFQFVLIVYSVCWICNGYGIDECNKIRCFVCSAGACSDHMYVREWIADPQNEKVCHIKFQK